ncbi:MAG: cbb3-type cytochrome c oxidase subunit I [Burkholderiaceae bacterium]|nr:cbb3-type cytochrome c oxidase subunit I [Burkholderiaceae bacterium]
MNPTVANTHREQFAAIPAPERTLVKAIVGVALVALALGVVGGTVAALARAGFIEVDPNTGYRALTLHGVAVFFYWLFCVQAALLLALTSAELGGALVWRRAAWVGFGLMCFGLLISVSGVFVGLPALYDGTPELVSQTPRAMLAINSGYVALGTGLIMLPLPAIATLLASRRRAPQRRLSAVGFALFVWAGFLAVSGFAAVRAFLPGALWSLELGPFPASQGTDWHVVFHNMHYLPLMATVILWYVLMRELTGVKSVFGERFSKIVFSMYLVFVPPTSLYHMFLEPDLPAAVRVAGSLLSLFVSVPTLTAFLIIIASLELHARHHGGRGLFGWMRMLPWRHPATNAVAVAALSLGLGLSLAFVLIQEKLAPLLSDTFFVPGYFHFFTLGTVTLTLLAALAVVLPALGGRTVWRPEVLRWVPWAAFSGLLVFGLAGVGAGYLGVPRRVFAIAYQGQAPAAWRALMAAMGLGGTVMALALTVFAAGIAVALLPRPGAVRTGAPLTVAWGGAALRPGAAAWVGPVSVLAIVAAMFLFTAIGFELMRALPVTGAGGAGH